MEVKMMIQSVIKTLNTIDVRGKDNLDKLLGCILALEQIIAEEEKTQNTNEVVDNG